MQIIIGYGNELRGEDGFGIEVARRLRQSNLRDTKIITPFQLTPELCLELLGAEKITFIDAAYDPYAPYALAVPLPREEQRMSHRLSPHLLMHMLRFLYGSSCRYELFSLCCCDFDAIADDKAYHTALERVVSFITRSN